MAEVFQCNQCSLLLCLSLFPPYPLVTSLTHNQPCPIHSSHKLSRLPFDLVAALVTASTPSYTNGCKPFSHAFFLSLSPCQLPHSFNSHGGDYSHDILARLLLHLRHQMLLDLAQFWLPYPLYKLRWTT